MYLGANFQAEVAAFFAAAALAEDTSAIPDEFFRDRPPTRIGAEQNWPVDDTAVWFGVGALAFLQAKASLNSSDIATSDFADVVDQFVRQWVHGRDRDPGTALTPDDRLLLVLGPTASGLLRIDLRTLLHRIAHLNPDESLNVATQGEVSIAAALIRVTAHVKRSLGAAGKPDTDANVRAILTHARVWSTSSELLLQQSRTLLRAFVVADEGAVDAALAVLIRHFAVAAQRRTAHSIEQLRSLLRSAGIVLKEPPNVASDVALLVDHTARTLRGEKRSLRTREGEVRIERAVTGDVTAALRHGDLIVTAEAGAGKSDVLLEAATALLAAGERVVFLDAADPAMVDPRRALGLRQDIQVVLDRWGDPNRIGYLFVDGFDSTRLGPSLDTLVRLVRHLQRGERIWHIVVASREYDLMHAEGLASLFPFDPSQPIQPLYRDSDRFGAFAHIVVPRLTDRELEAVRNASPALGAIIASASTALIDLLRNPFNLSIAASLTIGTAPDLANIRTQIQLLDLWWAQRVLPGANWTEKERVLSTLAREMIASRKLRLSREQLPGSAVAAELLSSTVLTFAGARERELAFRHAIVFDYAVNRLLFSDEGAIARVMGDDRDAFLFVLPSIRMRFDELWAADLARFYSELGDVFENNSQRRTLLMVAARIPFDHFSKVEDLAPLLDAEDARSLAAVRFIVRTLIQQREGGEGVIGINARPWDTVALAMSQRLPRHEHDTLLLLEELTRSGTMTATQLENTSRASLAAITSELNRSEYAPVYMRMAIQAFVRTYDANPTEAKSILNRILEPERIASYGQFELLPLTSEAKRIHNAEALETIFHALFSDIAVSNERIAFGAPSVIMSLVQQGQQSLQMARWSLGQRYPAFLEEHPEAAIRAISHVIEQEARRESPESQVIIEIPFHGEMLRLVHDASNIWDSSIYEHENWWIMAQALEARLRDTLLAGDPDLFVAAVRELQNTDTAMFLWRVLLRNAGANEVSARMMVPVVANVSALMSSELGEPIAAYLSQGYEKLETEDKQRVDNALVALATAEIAHEEYRDHSIELQQEYVVSIPEDAIVDDRIRTIRQGAEHPTEHADVRRRLTLSGTYDHGVSVSSIALSEEAQRAGASAELIEAITNMEPHFSASRGPAPANTVPIVVGVRDIVRLSTGQGEAVRQAVLDLEGMLIRRALELDVLSVEERSEMLPLVMGAAHGLHPQPQSEEAASAREESFARHPSWGTPQARTDAVQALWRLYRYEPREEILAEIVRLADDVDPAVRFLAIEGAAATIAFAPDIGWQLAAKGAADPNIAVLGAGLRAASGMGSLDPARQSEMFLAAFDRLVTEEGRLELRLDLLRWIMDKALYEGDADAMLRLSPLLNEPWHTDEAAKELIFELGNRIAPATDFEKRRIIAGTLGGVVTRLLSESEVITVQHGFNVDEYPADVGITMRRIIGLLTAVAERIYFSSGVMRPSQPNEDTGVLDVETFNLIRPLLTALGGFPFAATAYHVVRTLVGATDASPRDVLLLGCSTIMNGIRGGLLNEMLAEDDVRGFITRYIRMYRGLLEGDRDSLAAVMDVIDAYVDAGWPRWIEVVAELDRIYRAG